MSICFKKVLVSVSIVAASSVYAQSAYSNNAIGAKVGTLGVGIEYVTNISSDLDMRFGVNGFNYATNNTIDNINYDVDAKLLTVSAIADYHLFGNGFVLSGGVMYNGNNVDYSAKSVGGTYDINGVIYTATDVGSLNGNISFNKIAPYVGIGYSTVTKSEGWHFTAEAGVLYQGEADSTLNVQCGAALSAAQCTTLQNDVAAEKQAFDDDLKSYKWYPVLSLGVAYRF